MHSSAGTINPTRDFSVRAAGRPLSGKRRPPHSAAADSPPAAHHQHINNQQHHSPPTTTFDDIPQNYKPLLGRQIVLSVGEALSHPSAVDLRIRTNREALVAAHRARQAAEENKKILEKQCSDLQQLHEDERRRSAEQHCSSVSRPNSAARLTRAGISSNNSTFKMDDTTGNHSAATISFSRPSTATERRNEDVTMPRRPYSAVQRSALGRALTGPELVLKTMQLETSESAEQRRGGCRN